MCLGIRSHLNVISDYQFLGPFVGKPDTAMKATKDLHPLACVCFFSRLILNISYWTNFREQTLTDCHGMIDFQSDVVGELSQDADYGYDLNIGNYLHTWAGHKLEEIATYRDHSFPSKHTGTVSAVHHTPFMKAMDDSMECFLKSDCNSAWYVAFKVWNLTMKLHVRDIYWWISWNYTLCRIHRELRRKWLPGT